MTLTLLIDLDDTLLRNNIDTFLPAYLKALGKHMGNHVPPEKMVPNLLAATQVMIANNTAVRSLESAFDQCFYPAIGHSKSAMKALIDQFYDDIFPQLQPLTRQLPEAAEVVGQLLEQSHTLVVATNPMFPRKAIQHRLLWAGFPSEQNPFALITSYEQFHFAKPNPAYLAEILAQLGWPDQPAVMIGNSLEDDLAPAKQLGMPVFWIVDQPAQLPAGFHPLSASGSLSQVPQWVSQVDQANIKQSFSTPPALLALLKSTPAALDTLGMQISDLQWNIRPEPDEWSLTEVFCHLRDVDREVNIPRLEKVITGSSPFLAGINTDTWAEERNYAAEDGELALKQYIQTRMMLVDQLESMDEDAWKQPARHAIFGPTNLKELVSFITTHDRTHVQQCISTARTLAATRAS